MSRIEVSDKGIELITDEMSILLGFEVCEKLNNGKSVDFVRNFVSNYKDDFWQYGDLNIYLADRIYDFVEKNNRKVSVISKTGIFIWSGKMHKWLEKSDFEKFEICKKAIPSLEDHMQDLFISNFIRIIE